MSKILSRTSTPRNMELPDVCPCCDTKVLWNWNVYSWQSQGLHLSVGSSAANTVNVKSVTNNILISDECLKCENPVTFEAQMVSTWGEDYNTCLIQDGTLRRIQPNYKTPSTAFDDDVPENILQDYKDAFRLIGDVDRASVTLCRGAIQSVLREQGYSGKSLFDEIEDAYDDGALTPELMQFADTIRAFGNWGAHPAGIPSQEDIKTAESDTCIIFLEELMRHFYVLPADRQRRIDEAIAKGAKIR